MAKSSGISSEELASVPSIFIYEQPAERYQRQYSLMSRFGLQSNVIIAASYTNRDANGAALSKALVYPALRQVVQQYPELGMIYFWRLSEKKTSQHRCWSGFLRQINLDDHVKFMEIPEDEERQPPWQLVIINERHALLVYDHYITDGRGGTFIHDSLLGALNWPDQSYNDSPIVDLTVEVKGFPEEDPVKRADTGPSILYAIWSYISFWCILLVFRGTDLFFHDAIPHQPRNLVFTAPEKEDNSVRTKIQTLRLDAATMSQCLQACRKHQASFAGLLHTLIKATLAADFYAEARFSHSQIIVDARPYLRTQDRARTISGASSMISNFDWLSKFRQAGQRSNPDTRTPTDASLVWELARKHKASIVNDLNHTKTWLKAWLAIDLLGDDEEDYIAQFLPGVRLVQHNAFSISNLGAFEASSSSNRPEAGWNISNMEFSTGAWKAGYGPNLVFNVAGVKNGDTVIHVNYEEGTLRDEMVSSLLERVKIRMAAII